MEGQLLPRELAQTPQSDPNVGSAYKFVLILESDILQSGDENVEQKRKNLMYCRIIGYLLNYPPPQHLALKSICREIFKCQGNQTKLLDLGKWYFDHFIRAFRSNKGRTPAPSSHPSRPSFDKLTDLIKDMLEEPSDDRRTAKKRALIRDRFRCVISGSFDTRSLLRSQELKRELREAKGRFAATKCAHIIPESIHVQLSTHPDNRGNTTAVWGIFDTFGYKPHLDELNGPNIHRLENVITLDPNVYDLFDRLSLWLVPTNNLNQYEVQASDDILLESLPKYVTFRSDNEKEFPLPKREYLDLHATCARVAQFSGAADYIETTFQDLEDTLVLASDGSSAHLLEQALLYYTPRPNSIAV